MTRRDPGLDALRGLAALMIVVFHAVGVYAGGSAEDAWVRPWVARLDVGVPIFLLLSGFLLYRPWIVARRSGERLSAGRYASRRVLRVVPAYWVALTGAALALSLPGVLTLTGVARYYGFLQAYDAQTVGGGIPQAWTLCLEVAFYAFLPLWALLLRRAGRGLLAEAAGLAALALASVGWKAVVLAGSAPFVSATEPWLIALPGYLDMFALGMALALASVAWEERGAAPAWAARAPLAWWLAAAALFALAAVGLGLDDVDRRGFTHGQFALRHALYAAIALLVLLPVVAGSGLAARALGLRPLAHAGRISYGIYLWHVTVLGVLGLWGLATLEDVVHPYLLWLGCTLAGTLILAELSWRLVEAPALRLGPAWRPRRRRPAAPPARAP